MVKMAAFLETRSDPSSQEAPNQILSEQHRVAGDVTFPFVIIYSV